LNIGGKREKCSGERKEKFSLDFRKQTGWERLGKNRHLCK